MGKRDWEGRGRGMVGWLGRGWRVEGGLGVVPWILRARCSGRG